MTNEEKRLVVVPEKIEPIRLDKYLAGLPQLDITRSKIQKLISEGGVQVDGKPVDVKHKIRGGESISIAHIPPPVTDLQPEEIPLDIVHEDEHLLVVNKPAGMVTHPAAGNFSGTLVNALLHHLGNLPASSAPERPGIVHRLDKKTSGLLLVAKSETVLPKLQSALQEREINRTYLAIVWGHLKDEHGIIDLPIGRSIKNRQRMTVTSLQSREAKTEYNLRQRFRTFDLLELVLHTGRTHQIRVHMAHLGHPVFGDPEYGGREKKLRGVFAPERPLARELLSLIDRQALHAWRLEFVHPVSSETLSFTADPPEDFQHVLVTLEREGA